MLWRWQQFANNRGFVKHWEVGTRRFPSEDFFNGVPSEDIFLLPKILLSVHWRLLVLFFWQDVDECSTAQHACDVAERAICNNTHGSYLCHCRHGYCGEYGHHCKGKPIPTCSSWLRFYGEHFTSIWLLWSEKETDHDHSPGSSCHRLGNFILTNEF